MASNTTLAQELINIHRIITRALSTDIVNGNNYQQAGFPTDREMIGYIRFNRCLTAVICSHHQAEDLIAYPALRRVLSLAPYAQFTAEHRRIEALTALIPEVITDLSGDAPKYGLRVLVIILRKISKLWASHIQLEEVYFSDEAISAAMNAELQREICEDVSSFRHEHIQPPYWVVPFLLYNLEPQDRTSLATSFSPRLVDMLQQKEWKDEWSPMRPFLLN